MTDRSLNRVYSKPSMRKRYEVWFLRLMLADGSGSWWLRYLYFNPGKRGGGGCQGREEGMPAQVWATWFPRGGRPQSFIQGFPRDQLTTSPPGRQPFHFQVGKNRITDDACTGRLSVNGHLITWDLHYCSDFGSSMTEVGWIGFSRTPHSGATFSGKITLDGHIFQGDPLGYGLQGHNCGFRYRHLWNWTHCIFFGSNTGQVSTFEALEYEIPFHLRFRKALLWHGGQLYTFRKLEEIRRDHQHLQWMIKCSKAKSGAVLIAVIDGSGPSIHRLPYMKTDCSSTFDVTNNSLARAKLYLSRPESPIEELSTDGGAVLEMVGIS